MTAEWGSQIETVEVDGVPFRLYAERPRRLAELLDFADRWGDRPHIVQGDRVVGFAELKAAALAQADALASLGVGRGDRVVLLGWNSPEWVVNFWAATALGAVPVLANAWWSQTELDEALARLSPALVLADERNAARIGDGWATGPWSTAVAEIPDAAASVDRAAGAGARRIVADADENDPAAVIFTSGTEGRPKAVVLSQRSLLSGLQMLLHITRRLPHQVDDSAGEAALHTGPLFHIGGVQTLLRAMTVGDTLVMPSGRFDAGEAIRLIEQWKVRRWSAVPTMVSRVLEHPGIGDSDLGTLRSLTVGGAPVHAEFLARIRSGLNGVEPRIATGYGLTENGGQAVAASGHDTVDRPGSTGRPLPCVEIAIAPATEFTDGEILVRSPTQMAGYIDEASSPIDAEGWLHTGDLGRLDEGGYLWITGRSKDMIIRGGENIAPAAVEAVLSELPGVADAVVFGVPHADLGEEVMAVVVVSGDDVDAEALRAGLRGQVASFAVPSRWRLQAEPLPLNHAGKVDKPAVVREVHASLAGQSA